MSIEQSGVVDVIGLDKATGMVTLAISDHLDWSDEYHHLLLLQEKINTYLRYLESGEIVESYPQAEGRSVVIEVVGKYDLSDAAENFLGEARTVVENAGFVLRFRKLRDEGNKDAHDS